MTAQEEQAHLEGTNRDLGFVLELHKIMVEADLDWVKAFDPFVDATIRAAPCGSAGRRRLTPRTSRTWR